MSWRRRGSPKNGPAPHQWFPSPGKLASWVTLAPGNDVSAGKAKAREDRRRRNLRQADAGAGRLVGDQGQELAAGPGTTAWCAGWAGPGTRGARKKAILAIAHTLLKIAYAVLKSGRPYQEPGADFYTRRELPVQRRAWLEAQIQQLYPGCAVTVTVTPPPGSPPEAALTPALPSAAETQEPAGGPPALTPQPTAPPPPAAARLASHQFSCQCARKLPYAVEDVDGKVGHGWLETAAMGGVCRNSGVSA